MLCLVGDVAAEVPPDNAVPSGVVLLVKLLKRVKRMTAIRVQVTLYGLDGFILYRGHAQP